MNQYENFFYQKGYKKISGVDEAGRGCWAGPLVVAICCLPFNYKNPRITDSKKLSRKIRMELFEEIKNVAIYYDYIIFDSTFVDKNNPKQSSIIGMVDLINNAKNQIDAVLIDAEDLSNKISIPSISIVKGDSISINIAAASIIAKSIRDIEIDKLDALYPNYDFKNNQGYGTKKHQEILEIYGPIKGVHRYSYKPIKKIIKKNINN